MYKELAKKHGVSIAELKKEMQDAINAAFVNPNEEAQKIPRKELVPSINEFIDFVIKQLMIKDND